MNTITTKHIRSLVTPRQSHWYEASFILALVFTAIGVVLGFALFQFFGIEAVVSNKKIVYVPIGVSCSVLLGYALATRRTVLMEIQRLKAYAEGLKSLFSENKDLQQAYLELVKILALSLRKEASEAVVAAMRRLYTAFGAEKANAGNGTVPKFVASYSIVICPKIKTVPLAIYLAMASFWIMVNVIMLLPTPGGVWNWGDIALHMGLNYSFSSIFFVSINMLQIFGTRGSQLRVSTLIYELLDGIDD